MYRINLVDLLQDYGRPETTPCEGETLDKFSFERRYFDAVLRVANNVRFMKMRFVRDLTLLIGSSGVPHDFPNYSISCARSRPPQRKYFISSLYSVCLISAQ